MKLVYPDYIRELRAILLTNTLLCDALKDIFMTYL